MGCPMRKVSAAEANRHFSKILRDVQAGETIIVTSRGKPVAEIVRHQPVDAESEIERRTRLRREFLEELSKRPVLNLPKMTRDDFYD